MTSKLRLINNFADDIRTEPTTDEIRMEEVHDLMERLEIGQSGVVGNTWYGVLATPLSLLDPTPRMELVRANSEGEALRCARRIHGDDYTYTITGTGSRYIPR